MEETPNTKTQTPKNHQAPRTPVDQNQFNWRR